MKKKFWLMLVVVLLVGSLAGCWGKLSQEEKPVHGSWVGDVYTNEFVGISIKKPEGWVALSDEELLEAMGVVLDMYSEAGIEFNEVIADKINFFDALVEDRNTGNHIIIEFENLGRSGRDTITEEDFFDHSKENAKAMGFDFTDSEYRKETFVGQEYTTMVSSIEIDGIGMQQKIYSRKVDQYMFAIIITVYEGTGVEIEDLESYVFAVE